MTGQDINNVRVLGSLAGHRWRQGWLLTSRLIDHTLPPSEHM